MLIKSICENSYNIYSFLIEFQNLRAILFFRTKEQTVRRFFVGHVSDFGSRTRLAAGLVARCKADLAGILRKGE